MICIECKVYIHMSHLLVRRILHDSPHVAALYARNAHDALVDGLDAPEATWCMHQALTYQHAQFKFRFKCHSIV